MTTSSTSEAAAHMLDELQSLRQRTRDELSGSWYSLFVFGVALLLFAALLVAARGAPLNAYWPIAFVVCLGLITRHYRQRVREVGVAKESWPFRLITAAVIVGVYAIGALASGTLQDIGPFLISAAGGLVFAYLARSVVLAAFAVTLAAFTVALGMADVDHTTAILFAVFGAASLAMVFILKLRARE